MQPHAHATGGAQVVGRGLKVCFAQGSAWPSGTCQLCARAGDSVHRQCSVREASVVVQKITLAVYLRAVLARSASVFLLMLSFPYYNDGQELPDSPRTTAVHPVPGVATARRTRTDPAAASNSGAWRPVRTGTSQKGVQSYGVPPERHYSFKADANYSDTCDHSGQCS